MYLVVRRHTTLWNVSDRMKLRVREQRLHVICYTCVHTFIHAACHVHTRTFIYNTVHSYIHDIHTTLQHTHRMVIFLYYIVPLLLLLLLLFYF